MNTPGGHVRVWAVVPAAGEGRRMGGPKQTLPYRQSTMVGTTVRTLLRAGVEKVVVVTQSSLACALDLPEGPRVTVTWNDAGAAGEMIDSIRIGLAVLARSASSRKGPGSSECRSNPPHRQGFQPTASNASTDSAQAGEAQANRPAAPADLPAPTDGVLVVPADMPGLSVETCRSCLAAFEQDPKRIVIATCDGRRGHPILFPFSMREAIEHLSDGLRELPRRYPRLVHLVTTNDPGVLHDLDTPEEYRRSSP